MPIHEYGCQACGHSFDKFVRGYDAPTDVACPSCGATEVDRKMSLAGVTGVWQSKVPDFTVPKSAPVRPDDPFRCVV